MVLLLQGTGHTVEWHDGRWRYDLVYMSHLFTDSYSKNYAGSIRADHITKADAENFNTQYLRLEVKHTKAFHDHLLVLDRKTAHHHQAVKELSTQLRVIADLPEWIN